MSSKSRKSNHGVLRVTTAVRSKVGYVVTRHPLDLAAYELRVRTGRCFICALVQREPGSHHEIVWEDAEHIAFLNRYPTLYGYTIVAPRRHLERIERDLDKDAYLRLQSVVYAVARALEAVVDCERTYVLSLGSQHGNSHIHWHVAPLPSGVPYGEQQFHALMSEHGVIDWDDVQASKLGQELRHALHQPGGPSPS